MIDLRIGDELSFETPAALLLTTEFLDMILQHEGPVGLLLSWRPDLSFPFIPGPYFLQVGALRGARKTNARFLRAFRKATGLEAVMVASEQFRPSPLVAVFDFGYEEVERQVKSRGTIVNRTALERALQLGVSEEIDAAGTQHELARHHGLGSAVHRTARHSAGHHSRVSGSRARRAAPACARWARASPRR